MKVTCSSGRPSRSAATWVCAVAVPMPISCAAISTVAWPSAGQRDPRRAAGHAVIRIGRGGAAHADQPLALAACAGRRIALAPAEPLGAGAIGLDDVARGEGQCPRSDPSRARCGCAARSGPCRAASASSSIAHSSAKVPTDSPGARMKVLASMSSSTASDVELERVGGIGAARRQDERLGHGVVPRSSRSCRCGSALSKRAVRLGADRDPLLGRGCARRRCGTRPRATARSDRAPGELRRRRGQDLVLPQRLAAEAAADEGRRDVDLAPPRCRTSARATRRCGPRACVASWTRQLVALPGDRHGVQLDRIVVVTRRAIGRVDPDTARPPAPPRHRRSRSCSGSPMNAPGSRALRLGLGEDGHRRLGLIGRRGSATWRGPPAPASRRAPPRSAGRSSGSRSSCMTGRSSPPAAFAVDMKSGVGFEPRCVAMGHHQHHAGRRLGRARCRASTMRPLAIVL